MRSPASASADGDCSRLAGEAGRGTGSDRHPSVGRLSRAADHRHRALPARRAGPEVRRLAQQHLQPARARRHQRHRPRGARLRPTATGAAAAAGRLGQLALSRRPRLGAALSAHAELHAQLPTLRHTRRVRWLAAYREYIEFLLRTSSIVEFTQVWWSVRPHFEFGTVEVRICDAQSTAAESEALAALIVACVAQAARDVDEGVPFSDPPPRLIEENMWRAIRYGLDGKMVDLERAEEYPAAAIVERLGGLDRAGARRARGRAGVSRAQRSAATASDDRGGSKPRGGIRGLGTRDKTDLFPGGNGVSSEQQPPVERGGCAGTGRANEPGAAERGRAARGLRSRAEPHHERRDDHPDDGLADQHRRSPSWAGTSCRRGRPVRGDREANATWSRCATRSTAPAR